MANAKLNEHPREATSTPRVLAAQAFSRAAGAPLVHGNSIRLLRDADENYPAWLEAIDRRKKNVHFENYIIRDDDIGERFADALIAKAKEGVPGSELLYDWMGALTETGNAYWRRMQRRRRRGPLL